MAEDDEELYFDVNKGDLEGKFDGLWIEDLVELGIFTSTPEQIQRLKEGKGFVGTLHSVTMKQAREMGLLKMEN